MKENKEKRVLRVELDNEVKKVSITGLNSDEKVVMRQELSEEDLEQATGGGLMPTLADGNLSSYQCLELYMTGSVIPDVVDPLNYDKRGD